MQKPKKVCAILGFFLILPLLAACNRAALMAEPDPNTVDDFGLAILQGPTNDTSTFLSAMVPKDRAIEYKLFDKETGHEIKARATTQKKVSQDFSPWAAVRILYEGLDKTKTYEFRAIDDTGKVLDHREFALIDSSKGYGQFVAASCMDDAYPEQEDMWSTVISLNPQFLILMGDTVYADRRGNVKFEFADPEILWHRYVQTRNTLKIFRTPKLVPIFAVWDDHDFGKDDGDSTFKYKKEARETFEAFFPMTPAAKIFEHGPGLSSHFQVFSQDFFMMDDRSFRTKETHWGEAQEKWLISGVRAAKNPVWITNGVQFFGGYQPFESFEGENPAQFEQLIKDLKEPPVPVVFVSGDRHLTEILRIEESKLGFETFEITTSPIHAKTFPGTFVKYPSARQVAGRDGKFNFAFFKVEQADAHNLKFDVKVMGENQEVLYEKALQVKR